MASFLDTYRRVTRLPFGNFLFNKGIGIVAPFFGKIRPDVIELQPSSCVVRMRDRRSIRNHIGTVNAGAMCTLAELTAGMALDATIPRHLRWIPREMTVAYLAKGRGTLEATSTVARAAIREGSVVVPVSVRNADDDEVFTAAISFHISRKKGLKSQG